MTMKAHTYYIIFGRPPIGDKLPPTPRGGATAYMYPPVDRIREQNGQDPGRVAHTPDKKPGPMTF